jgi:cytochrome c2
MNSKLLATLILTVATTSAQVESFAKGDAEAGKALFDKNKCSSCHISTYGGDGSKMFTRADRKIKSASSLLTQVTRCSTNLNLSLFDEDEENIAAFLNKTYYKFK